MTVVEYSEIHKFQTLNEFMKDLDVSTVELLEAIGVAEQAYDEYCEIAENEVDWSPAASLDEVPDDFLREYKQGLAVSKGVRDVLEQRDGEYVYLIDSSLHTVIEL